MATKAVTTTTSIFPVAASEVARLLHDGLEPGEHMDLFSLPRVNVPVGGGLSWQMPNGESVKALEGVIVVRTIPRAYYATSIEDSGGGSPPDCASEDGVTGVGSPGGECATCPFAVYGSGKGDAQACHQRTRLFLMDGTTLLPLMIDLGPSAFRTVRRYVFAVMNAGTPLWHVRTSIGLVEAKSGSGIKYSLPELRSLGPLAPAQRAEVDAYRVELLPLVRRIPVEVEQGDAENL